jgi:spore coat polysaccharide biosynthesis protein SpsF
MKARIGVFVQARMTSERLPGKVMAQVQGRPMLQYLLERLGRCSEVAQAVVLTSDHPADAAIAAFCSGFGVECFRGDLLNVAKRFLDALDCYGWDGFVRISGDSPMLDQRLVDRAVSVFRQDRWDLVSNVMPRSWPPGQSVEVVRSEAFRRVVPRMDRPAYREHVTPYFYENQCQFRIFNILSETQLTAVRLSVDTKADLEVFARIVGRMDRPHWQYGLEEIVELYRQVAPLTGAVTLG